MCPNGGAYATFDSGSIEGGLGLDEECTECVILVECSPITLVA